jgi:hypothetical protein
MSIKPRTLFPIWRGIPLFVWPPFIFVQNCHFDHDHYESILQFPSSRGVVEDQMIKRIIFKFIKVYMENGHIYIHYLRNLHIITMPLNNDACS